MLKIIRDINPREDHNYAGVDDAPPWLARRRPDNEDDNGRRYRKEVIFLLLDA